MSSQLCFALPGPIYTPANLKESLTLAFAMNSRVPFVRWSTTQATDANASSGYGAFAVQSAFPSDADAFGISRVEA